MKTLTFTVYLEPQPEGGFTATVPAIPEVVTEGDTKAEALAMTEEAIRAVIAHRRDHGVEMPDDMLLILTPEEVAPRHPEIDAALAEALEDVRAGRVTPAFDSMKEYEAWCLSDEGKRFRA